MTDQPPDYYLQILVEAVTDLIELLEELKPFSFDLEWSEETSIATLIFNTESEMQLVLDSLDFEPLMMLEQVDTDE